MKSSQLGTAWQSFGPNIRITLALLGIGGLFSWLAYAAAREFGGIVSWTIFYFLGIGFGLLLIRHLFFRLWVHDSGVSYRTVLGHGEILWRELDRIYFGSYDIHVHYIALGTFYRLRLVTKKGEKLSLGERLHAAKDLAELIHGYTLQEMLRQALHGFERGVPLDFGAIRIGRKEGLSYRKWFAWHSIQWQDLDGFGANDSHVRVSDFNKWFGANIPAEKIANVHVLEEMLDRVQKKTLTVGI